MIQTLSETVILPIAGVILAIVMTLELIQIVTDHNNFHEIETAVFFKWMFKSACAILIVTNTWTIVMGIFDAAQSVVAQAAGVVVSDATVDISTMMDGLEERLMEMDLGALFGLWFQSLFVGITAWAVAICIFIVIYGRNAAPVAVIECKRPEVTLDKEVLMQAIRYNMVLNVKYIIVTNGRSTHICERKADGSGYVFTGRAPQYDEMIL